MAHKIHLNVDGKPAFPLIACTYNVFRATDSSGKPAGGALAGHIVITRESSDDAFFYHWAIDNAARKNGNIVFSKMNVDDTMKTLEFENAFIVTYEETCGFGEQKQMMEHITISAQKIRFGGATQDNRWPSGT